MTKRESRTSWFEGADKFSTVSWFDGVRIYILTKKNGKPLSTTVFIRTTGQHLNPKER